MIGGKGAAIGAGALAGLLLVCCGGFLTLFGGGGSSWCSALEPDAEAASGDWNATQVGHAAAIVQAGIDAGVPPRGWTIALATAMQESNLKMYANGTVPESLELPHEDVGYDHDSVGLFQQRYPMWGSLTELMDARTSAMKFYDSLLDVDGWQDMVLTEAAQAVQGSAFPNAYAKWESAALELTEALTGQGAATLSAPGCDAAAAAAVADGGGEVPVDAWTAPVDARIWSHFRTSERPGHDGVDFSGDDAPRGTPIRAAATGIVRYSECNSPTCAMDGSPEMSGCGWMTVIDHGRADDPYGAFPGVATRYCHMNAAPFVQAGDRVWAGQVIGVVGNTGSSSGPHLHFEVHAGVGTDGQGRLQDRTAVDPVHWLSTMGVVIG
jgi:murein DD-endopeptidase MepM/ murein hydrolase activator NlpD